LAGWSNGTEKGKVQLMFSTGRCVVCTAALLIVTIWAAPRIFAQSSLPVIPGGQGFGMSTRAAYGCGPTPAILRVTNLNDSGPGSFRDAVTAATPRVVIFETSGTILLASDIDLTQPCITIAGQTAPSPGITIRNGGINVYAHDVVIQHIRIRPGDGGAVQAQTAGHDATDIYANFGYEPHDIVYDHVSISWGAGKNVNIGADNPSGNVTYWRCIISEALYYAKNVVISAAQPSSLGMLMWNSTGRVSVIGNLFAHNSDRNPEIHENADVHFINNVVYDWGKDQTWYAPASFLYQVAPGRIRAAFAGNRYIAGPPPHPFTPLYGIAVWSNVDPQSQIYIADNSFDDRLQAIVPFNNWAAFDPRVSTPPLPMDGITVRSSSDVEAFVLANAGARPKDRDAVDRRIVNEVTSRTGTVISSQDQVGGWPALSVVTRSLTIPDNPHSPDGSGYTALERWLQGFAAALEGTGTAPATPTGVKLKCTSACP
jgi:hypothetical protein